MRYWFCYQNGPSFNVAVDALVKSNGLLPAVPLYEATFGHPEYFYSGDVHPNAAGCAVWNQTFSTDQKCVTVTAYTA